LFAILSNDSKLWQNSPVRAVVTGPNLAAALTAASTGIMPSVAGSGGAGVDTDPSGCESNAEPLSPVSGVDRLGVVTQKAVAVITDRVVTII
jgi:hypothetical protein